MNKKNDQISKNFQWWEMLVSNDFPEIVNKYSLFPTRELTELEISIVYNDLSDEANSNQFDDIYVYCWWLRTKIFGFTFSTIQPLRTEINLVFTILNGYRPDELNYAVGGHPNSKHRMFGFDCATDFTVEHCDEGFYKREFEKVLKLTRVPFGKCIIYPERLFVHIDNIDKDSQYEVIYK